MNQKGETILFFVLILVVISGLFTLCGLELQRSFSLLQKRTNLFICVKQTKGEIHRYLDFMGKTNWALKNSSKAQLIATLIPGLQGIALNAEKMKKTLKHLQTGSLINYQAKILQLKIQGCQIIIGLNQIGIQSNGALKSRYATFMLTEYLTQNT